MSGKDRQGSFEQGLVARLFPIGCINAREDSEDPLGNLGSREKKLHVRFFDCLSFTTYKIRTLHKHYNQYKRIGYLFTTLGVPNELHISKGRNYERIIY